MTTKGVLLNNEENSLCNIFTRPGLCHIADNILLYLDILSLNKCRSVSHTWNNNIREFISRKFLRLEDIVLLPAMSHEYKKQRLGGTLDYQEEDELEQMAAKLVCYHVKGFKKGETGRDVSAKFQVLLKWRNKMFKELLGDCRQFENCNQHCLEKRSSE